MKTLEKNRNKYNRRKSKYKKYLEETWTGIPATVRSTLFEMTLKKALSKSFVCHIIALLLVWLLVSIFNILGITPKIFPKEKLRTRNIEFILPKRQKQQIASYEVQTTTNPPQGTQNPTNSKETNPTITKNNQTSNKPKSSTSVPDFAIPMPSLKSLSTGLSSQGSTKKHAAGVESINSSALETSDNLSSSTKGVSDGSGFDKNATKKLIASYDISPYVNELRRNVQWNWKSPHGSSKRVELFLRIAKDGRLIILNVKRTSEIGEVDNAALNAVKKCLPLNPLPTKYPKSYLDVVFVFDTNSIGSRY